MSLEYRILLVEDNPDHALLATEAIEAVHGGRVRIHHAHDADDALEFLADAREPLPNLMLVDIKMPGLGGFGFLERVKSDTDLRVIPIVMLSSSDDERDIARSYGLGSNSFVTKPVGAPELFERVSQIPSYWFGVNTPPPHAGAAG